MKLKTHKGTRKRFKITGTNKLLRRTAGQDHFNARESSKVTKNKRRDKTVDATSNKTMKRLIPYR